jgi:hypothetical protein
LQPLKFEARDDLVDVSLAGLNHLIRRPTQIEITEEADASEPWR